ncbi:hypothetical protein SEVIR_2G142350v4 [Setaria viridis]
MLKVVPLSTISHRCPPSLHSLSLLPTTPPSPSAGHAATSRNSLPPQPPTPPTSLLRRCHIPLSTRKPQASPFCAACASRKGWGNLGRPPPIHPPRTAASHSRRGLRGQASPAPCAA